MSTWFHDFETKRVNCKRCGLDFESHAQSGVTLCLKCLRQAIKEQEGSVLPQAIVPTEYA